MRIFKVLSVFVVAGLLFAGCKSGSEGDISSPPASPMGAGDVDLGSTNIGEGHTSAASTEKIEAGSITKAEGGQTVADLFSKKDELSGKQVSVHGKVVKFSGGIMGTNWVHIQDGTGNSVEGTNDITVTTQDNVSVDAIVTVTGNLTTDKDFGAGYKYDVIIEDASVKAD